MNDPYAALGLRRNPFVAEPQPGVDEHLWLDRGYPAPATGGRCFIQVLGEKGAGKTSLLLHWRQHTAGPYHYVPIGWRRWNLPPVAPVVYWDELDRLPRILLLLSLWRAAALGATVIAGTHADLSRTAKKFGFRTRTITFEPLSAALIQAWADMRIAAASLRAAGMPNLVLDSNTATDIAAKAGTSWRVAADLLHVWAADQAQNALANSGIQAAINR